ncbi:serum paraoxonase/arylesterase 2-like [Pecten maximus]|uniref:serum paraoxonase/arylesterase 2-like n=1 Tax=Pecten maximus TaxID=6579 RepID=UPI001458D90C|nr:serum paraoxonase/arylesterase 2-like [Pecten maximus]
MVINHAGHHDRVEVFTFQEDSLTLLHVNSILSPKRNYMNDLVMTSNRTFYITEYGEMRDNPLLEMLLMLSYCDILYYNGSEFRSVAHGLRMANGINVSPDHRYLYVAELGRKQLKSYRIKDTELEHVEDLFLDTLLDNRD